MEYKNKALKIFVLTITLIIVSFPSIIGTQTIQKNSINYIKKVILEDYNILLNPSLKLWIQKPSLPPENPQKPSGPNEWVLDLEATFETFTIDPEGNKIYYLFNWGDGSLSEWLGPFVSGEIISASHAWTTIGNYEVKVMAKDVYQSQSNWSEPAIISIIKNTPPEKATIIGPKIGITRIYHDFSINSTDPNEHDLYYYVNWGDGDYLNWVGPYKSGLTVEISHSWNVNGNYAIIVIVKDQFESKSQQSQFQFLAIKNRSLIDLSLNNFYENIIDRIILLKNLFL